MATVKRIKSDNVFQLKITLNHIKPPIWRRVLVDSDIKLPDLHKIIQTVMGWTNSHLHQFIIGNQYYSLPSDESFYKVVDYRRIKLDSLFNTPKSKFIYEYDFGDGWEHSIVIEKILPREKNTYYPICIDGKRSCPPEDCGGTFGYENLITIINNPEHEEYDEMMEWLGDYFDPKEFNIDEVNEFLREKNFGCVELFD
ncbi:MAG TPA: plasmid pRiA4b ORF-3 family protein [Smithella sp.]|nr:plasmid pRiA4b ORF-3 family protein [Smithella sp.]